MGMKKVGNIRDHVINHHRPTLRLVTCQGNLPNEPIDAQLPTELCRDGGVWGRVGSDRGIEDIFDFPRHNCNHWR